MQFAVVGVRFFAGRLPDRLGMGRTAALSLVERPGCGDQGRSLRWRDAGGNLQNHPRARILLGFQAIGGHELLHVKLVGFCNGG